MSHARLCGLFALGSFLAFAQLGGPQYPGRYPGDRPAGPSLPRRGKKDKDASKQQEEQLKNLRGMLRKLDEKELVLETSDQRILHVLRASKTKYLKEGEDLKPAELQPGDHLLVEATEDNQGRFTAVIVTFEKAGTPGERIRARGVIDDSLRMGTDDETKPANDSAKPAPDQPAEPVRVENPTTELSKAGAPDRDDPGPPRLVHGGSPARKTAPSPARETAERRTPPELPAEPAEPAAPPPPPLIVKTDPFIEKARETAVSFTETLPNYMVKQLTTRFASVSAKADWRAQDQISSDVVYENGRESYRNILLNGKPAKGKVEETGSWSTGEFGTVLRDLFSPASAASFSPRGSVTIVNRSANVYSFTVEQPNSHWQIIAPGQSYRPAYRGKVWIDRESARVLRIEMQTRNMPSEFPLDTVESTTDYEFIRLGTVAFLLPTHAEMLSCVRGTSQCTRNVIEFRNYRKFGAESSITFKP